MTLPSLPFPDDIAALAERTRAHAPVQADTLAFRQVLDDRAAAAGREEYAASQHGDRPKEVDDDLEDQQSASGKARRELHTPLTIHALNELLLAGGGSGTDAARAGLSMQDASRTSAQRISREPIGARLGLPTDDAWQPTPARSTKNDVVQQTGPIVAEPRSAAQVEAGAGHENRGVDHAAPRSTTHGESPAVLSASSSPVAGAAVAPAPQASARGESLSARPNSAAAGAVQGASAAAPGRRSGADAHLPRWMMPRGSNSNSSARTAQANGRAEAFAAQVSRGLAAAMSRGAGDVTLRLNPESLGFLRVKLEVRPEGVAARFEVSTDAARRLLEQNSETLRAALEARGWESAEIRVALLEERDTHPSAAELLRRLAREGEAVAQHAISEPGTAPEDTTQEDPHDPRSGKDGSAAQQRGDDGPAPEGVDGAFGDGHVWLIPGAVDVLV
ncbi:MAG: flagellar hook-length control protein FliK [Phycisphaeraceae bacterium]|nr:flagellar hook-length control protein FliK [Phycisphaeraceae bacterium]